MMSSTSRDPDQGYMPKNSKWYKIVHRTQQEIYDDEQKEARNARRRNARKGLTQEILAALALLMLLIIILEVIGGALGQAPAAARYGTASEASTYGANDRIAFISQTQFVQIYYVGGTGQTSATGQSLTSGDTYATVGTITGSSIVFGLSTLVFVGSDPYNSITAVSISSVCIAYYLTSATSDELIMASISGTGSTATITMGSASGFASSQTSSNQYKTVSDVDSQMVIVAWENSANNEAYIRTASINTTTISGYGTALSFTTSLTLMNPDALSVLSSTVSAVSYRPQFGRGVICRNLH